ncbi:quinon protein alcohol dehydrogenase-like superfamily [Aspergillus granulosus]|uniref:Quinon protein alcohol dehydrogenase-like superfamily n=1 Tax=Aspergillus granulosus TaxID=176169 RepID=A0ABR4HNY0_9EURO
MPERKYLPPEDYTVGIIYVKPLEMTAITTMVDRFFLPVRLPRADRNEYTLGRIGSHNVVIAGPPRGSQGKSAAAIVACRIQFSFPNVTVGLLVGIGGGVPHLPDHDVRLGDVVVGAPEYGPSAVQYDLGKQTDTGFEVSRTLDRPPDILLGAVGTVLDEYNRAPDGESFFQTHLQRFANTRKLKRYNHPHVRDRLFTAEYDHDGTPCSQHPSTHEVQRPHRDPADIHIHYSTILSGDAVMKSAKRRDELSSQHHNALCFEMEAAGVMNEFRCLVVRGICDYADSHKNKEWQGYAAATAAAYARQILLVLTMRLTNGTHEKPAWEEKAQPGNTQHSTNGTESPYSEPAEEDKSSSQGLPLINTISSFDGELVTRGIVTGYALSVNSVAFSPDGSEMASGSDDCTVRVWNTANGKERMAIKFGGFQSVTPVAFSPDGNEVAAGLANGYIRILNTATGKERIVLKGNSQVKSMAFSPDGKTLACCPYSSSRNAELWDVTTGTKLRELRVHCPGSSLSSLVESVAFSPDGRTLAIANGIVELVNPDTGMIYHTIKNGRGVAFSPDSKSVAVIAVSPARTIRLHDTATGKAYRTGVALQSPICSMAFSPDGRLLACGSLDKTVRLWDCTTGEARGTLKGHDRPVYSVAFSPDGNTLAAPADKVIYLWGCPKDGT